MKSQSTFYVDLFQKVHHELSYGVCKKDIARDLRYALSRFDREGLSFFTIALPNLGKAIVKGIESGALIPPQGFKTERKGSLLPSFLRGWTTRLFTSDGKVSPAICASDVSSVLQICMLFYKLELPYPERLERSVIATFVSTEDEVTNYAKAFPSDNSMLAHARVLVGRLLNGFNPKQIEPKHGPGAVATGERGNSKFAFKRRYQRLHLEFPYYEYFSPSLSRRSFEDGWYGTLRKELNPIAKVCLVPKDSRGPRLISMEPLEVQFIQQGILAKLVPYLEKHPLTKGRINFSKQTFNQELALESSMTLTHSTLDLKEASDRVSLKLVEYLFPKDIYDAFCACRSVATQLPSGDIIPLRKFAPMGSALCFPVMAIVIWSIIEATRLTLHPSSPCRFLVYGDDVIVSRMIYKDVINSLSVAGLLVNKDKSFHNSHFRESCGMDAFNGVQVTPARIKVPVDGGRLCAPTAQKLLAFSETLFDKGLWFSSDYIRKYVSKNYAKLPWVGTRGDLGIYCPDHAVCRSRNHRWKHRWNTDLQRWEVLRTVIRPKKEVSYLPFRSTRMLKALLGFYAHGPENYRVTPRRERLVKRSWCPV